jgi:hypothetical protein
MDAKPNPTHIAIPASRAWGYRLLVIGLLMIGAGVAGYLLNPPPLSWIAAAAGGLGLLIAAGVYPFFMKHPPAIETDDTGVTIRTMMVTVVRLPWPAVERFEVITLRNSTRWLAVRVRDPLGAAELWNPMLAEAMEKAASEAQRETGTRYGALIPRHTIHADLDAAAERLNQAARAATRTAYSGDAGA